VTLPVELAGARRVLAVQPHYDDNDIGAGGTLAELAAAGAELHYLTVTDDLIGVLDPGLTDEEATARLRAEQEEAGRTVGVASHAWLGLPDAGEYSHHDVRSGVIEHVRRLRPDVLFTVDPWLPTEAHGDHRKTGFAVAEAALVFGFPRLRTDPDADAAYFAADPHALSSVVFYFTVEPTHVVDIGSGRAAKHRALDAYRSQFTPEGLEALHRGLELRERQWAGRAERAGCEHGEPVRLLRPFELHCHFDPAIGPA
jgi:LmbE family N-acetylglucosaminyl deacetylase